MGEYRGEGLIGADLAQRLEDCGAADGDPELIVDVVGLVEAMAERILAAERELTAVKVAGGPCAEARCYRAAGHAGEHEDIASRWGVPFPLDTSHIYGRGDTNG